MVSGVHSDSSRSDPERPRGPRVHNPYVWNSKPFTIIRSASMFLPDLRLISLEWLYLLHLLIFLGSLLWNYWWFRDLGCPEWQTWEDKSFKAVVYLQYLFILHWRNNTCCTDLGDLQQWYQILKRWQQMLTEKWSLNPKTKKNQKNPILSFDAFYLFYIFISSAFHFKYCYL